MLLIALLVVGIFNSGYIAFTAAYNMGKYDAAKSIQGWSFNNNGVKSNIEKFVIGKTESYYDDFSAEKITYEEANEKFDIAKAAIASKAIPNCNITIMTGEEMKTNVNSYLTVLHSSNPQAVGGTVPADDFYCTVS